MTAVSLTESRYDRQERITWWNQDRLRASSVLVVGAGALGNEIVKNLALLGVGRIEVIDLDTVENSNLARCVMFREIDQGRPKAEVVAAVARELNPDVALVAHVGSVLAVPLGWLARFNLVIAGLDNREARLFVNQACRKLGLPWVDGAIEGLQGLARVFVGDGPCYECTLSEVDRSILALRRSCSLLTQAEMTSGRVPTTATTGSLVAAVEVQEAIKLLSGRADLLALRNQALVFTGETLETYHLDYGEDPDCPAHDRYGELLPAPLDTTLAGLAMVAAQAMGAVLALDFEDDLVVGRRCAPCGWGDAPMAFVATLRAGDGECPTCTEPVALDLRRTVSPDDPLAGQPMNAIGFRAWDVVTARSGDNRVHFVLEAPAS